jgi:hypothetical protein
MWILTAQYDDYNAPFLLDLESSATIKVYPHAEKWSLSYARPVGGHSETLRGGSPVVTWGEILNAYETKEAAQGALVILARKLEAYDISGHKRITNIA